MAKYLTGIQHSQADSRVSPSTLLGLEGLTLQESLPTSSYTMLRPPLSESFI